MTTRDMEDNLFSEWKIKRPDLIPDGIIDEPSYNTCPVKVLYILKEVNGGKDWDLRDFIYSGGRARTWNNIARWQYAIENYTKEVSFSEVQSISVDFRRKMLKKIAVINLKKESGGSFSNLKQIWAYSCEDKEFIKKQIKLCNPDIIICCGTGWIVKELKLTDLIENNNLVLIDFNHPQAMLKAENQFLKLIEILQNKQTGY